MARRRKIPDGAAGILVETILATPTNREQNIQTLRDQVRMHREAGNLMHLAIYEDALSYFEKVTP